jgi:hypothetical protein
LTYFEFRHVGDVVGFHDVVDRDAVKLRESVEIFTWLQDVRKSSRVVRRRRAAQRNPKRHAKSDRRTPGSNRC